MVEALVYGGLSIVVLLAASALVKRQGRVSERCSDCDEVFADQVLDKKNHGSMLEPFCYICYQRHMTGLVLGADKQSDKAQHLQAYLGKVREEKWIDIHFSDMKRISDSVADDSLIISMLRLKPDSNATAHLMTRLSKCADAVPAVYEIAVSQKYVSGYSEYHSKHGWSKSPSAEPIDDHASVAFDELNFKAIRTLVQILENADSSISASDLRTLSNMPDVQGWRSVKASSYEEAYDYTSGRVSCRVTRLDASEVRRLASEELQSRG